jgi:transposase
VLTDQITEQLHAHTDAQVLTSLPRAGTIRAARLLAEIGDARGRFPTPEALAKPHRRVSLGGGPPATRRARGVGRRLPAEQPMGRRHLPTRPRPRPRSPHAVRVLARAWVYVIWRCWQDGGASDPTKHAGLQRLCSTPRTRGRMN